MSFNPVNSVNIGPFLGSLQQNINSHLPYSSSKVMIFLESSALKQTLLTTLSNIAYISPWAKDLGVQDCSHFLSSRVNCAESALLSLASLVHSIFWSVIYLGLAVITLGQSGDINYGLNKHWYHIALSAACIGINTIGVVVPTVGAYANLGVVFLCLKSVSADYKDDLDYFEKPLVEGIKKTFAAYRDHIKLFLLNHVKSDQYFYSTVGKAVDEFDRKIQVAKTVESVVDAFAFVFAQFPDFKPRGSISPLGSRKNSNKT